MVSFIKKDLSKLHNIGDLLCTPDNYFDIETDKDITFVGGGVWNIDKLAKNPKTVVWAVGRSIRHPNQATKLKPFKFLSAGFRDLLDLDDDSLFLPCVSCLNDDLMIKPHGDKTLVFTNANQQVSSIITDRNDCIVLTNACSTEEFLSAWKQCDKVITNSYHGIYWSLLTERLVAPYGYSSKFVNVTAMFDIEFPYENLYTVSERHKLRQMVNNKKQTYITANKSELNRFRELNMNFAYNLNKVGIECKKKK